MATTAGTTTNRGYPYPGDASTTNVPGDLKAALVAIDTDVAALNAAGNVSTTDLAASAVTTAKIADAAVATAKLADGAVTAAKTSGLLPVTAVGNKATDNQSVFTTDLSGWNTATGAGINSVNGTTFTRDTGVTIDGYNTMKIVADGSAILQGASTTISGLKPSTTYTVVVKMKASGSSRGCRLYVRDPTVGSGSDKTTSVQTSSTAAEHRTTITTGASSTSLLISAQCPASTGAAETIYVSKLGVWEGTGGAWALAGSSPFGTTTADGAVTATQIADGTITGDKLASGVGDPTGAALILLSASTTSTITTPDTVIESVGAAGGKSIIQHQGYTVGGNTIQAAADDLAPIWIGLPECSNELYGGNHLLYTWVQSAGSLTTGDVGKVWTDGGSWRSTLLALSGGNAIWSLRHNSGLTSYDFSTPSGTWTCTTSGPSQTWSSPTMTSNFSADKSIVETGYNWASGRPGVACRRTVQTIASYMAIVAAAQGSVGTPITAAAATTLGVLTTDWRWYGDQPGTVIVDVTFTAGQSCTIKQWSGLQAGKAATTSGTAVVGMAPGHALATWNNSIGSTLSTLAADWANSTFPVAWLTRGTYGGVGLGILSASGITLSSASGGGEVGTTLKLYPSAVGTAASLSLSAGQTIAVHGWRSVTADTSDRHVHVVKDPDTGVTRWFLMAGSTGTATHASLARYIGRRVATTRGTATVDTIVAGTGALTVTGSGWAEGTIT